MAPGTCCATTSTPSPPPTANSTTSPLLWYVHPHHSRALGRAAPCMFSCRPGSGNGPLSVGASAVLPSRPTSIEALGGGCCCWFQARCRGKVFISAATGPTRERQRSVALYGSNADGLTWCGKAQQYKSRLTLLQCGPACKLADWRAVPSTRRSFLWMSHRYLAEDLHTSRSTPHEVLPPQLGNSMEDAVDNLYSALIISRKQVTTCGTEMERLSTPPKKRRLAL